MTDLLENYASRGIFRGFSRGAATASRASYKIVWHRSQEFELIFDVRKASLRMPSVLPAVGPAMFEHLSSWIAEQQSAETLEHRRIDSAKARVECAMRGKDAALTVTAVDGDVEYAVRKLIHLVHEIYLSFLHDGRYYDYLIETFNLDPDFVQFS